MEKRNGRRLIVLLLAVLVVLAVLTLTACEFGTSDDDKDPSGTGGLTDGEMESLISDRVSKAEWNTAWKKVMKSSARTADFSIAAKIVESDSEQSNENGIKCMFGDGRVYGKEFYRENSVSDSYEYYYEYNNEIEGWYCYKRDKSGDWEKSVDDKDVDITVEDLCGFILLISDFETYADYTYNSAQGCYESSLIIEDCKYDLVVKLKDGNLVWIDGKVSEAGKTDLVGTLQFQFYDYGATEVTLPTIDDDDNSDDGNPDDGNPDDGNPDDGNPDDGNPDDGNPDDGNPDDGNPDDGESEFGNAAMRAEIDNTISDQVSEAEWNEVFDQTIFALAYTVNFTVESEMNFLENNESSVSYSIKKLDNGDLCESYIEGANTDPSESYRSYDRTEDAWYRYTRDAAGSAWRKELDGQSVNLQVQDLGGFPSITQYGGFTYNFDEGYYEFRLPENLGVLSVKIKNGKLIYYGAEGWETDGSGNGIVNKIYFYDYGSTDVTLPTNVVIPDDGNPDDGNPDDGNPDDGNPDDGNPDFGDLPYNVPLDELGNPAKREEIDNLVSDRLTEAEWNALIAKYAPEAMQSLNLSAELVMIGTLQDIDYNLSFDCNLQFEETKIDSDQIYYYQQSAIEGYIEEDEYYFAHDLAEGQWYQYRRALEDQNSWLKYAVAEEDAYDNSMISAIIYNIVYTLSVLDFEYDPETGCYTGRFESGGEVGSALFKISDGNIVYYEADGSAGDTQLQLKFKVYFYDSGLTEVNLPTDIVNTDGVEYSQIYNSYEDEDVLGWKVVGYHGPGSGFTIPAEFLGYPVSEIDHEAFKNRTDLTSITIPESVTKIGFDAFYGCDNLIQVENGVYYVDRWVLDCDTSVTTVALREGTFAIDYSAFEGCSNLTDITIPGSVALMDIYEFTNDCSSLENVTFGDNSRLENINNFRFGSFENLETVTFGANSPLTDVQNMFNGCTNLTSVSFGDNSQLTCIGLNAFHFCTSLTSVSFGENSQLTSIDGMAFDGCTSLASITIPASVTKIGFDAFYGCTALTTIYFEGTRAEWNAVEREHNWVDDINTVKIVCTDGEVVADYNVPLDELGNPAKREEIDNSVSDRLTEAEWNDMLAKYAPEAIRSINLSAELVTIESRQGFNYNISFEGSKFDDQKIYTYIQEATKGYIEEDEYYKAYDGTVEQWYRYVRTPDGNNWQIDQSSSNPSILNLLVYEGIYLYLTRLTFSYDEGTGSYLFSDTEEGGARISLKIENGNVVYFELCESSYNADQQKLKLYFYDYNSTDVILPNVILS